jgi:hypothetical protein
MNKKLNTAIFFLVATVINIAMILVLALIVFIPYALFVASHVPPMANLVVLVLIFLGSMAGSFPLYRKLVEWFQKKVAFEKYFDPIIRQSSKRGRRD